MAALLLYREFGSEIQAPLVIIITLLPSRFWLFKVMILSNILIITIFNKISKTIEQ